jgi:hypothetical protein
MKEREDIPCVSRNVSRSKRSVYKMAGGALRLAGEVGEGDLREDRSDVCQKMSPEVRDLFTRWQVEL